MRPNLIFILMDDLGWKDLGCYGSEFYETPNLDRLAKKSVRFTDAYAACPVSSPSRASIMTGKYPARVGVTDWINWSGGTHPCKGRLIDAPYLNHLPLTETSLARALKEGGYRTWHVGKWHLGGPDHYPDRHGFDVNIGGSPRGCPKTYFSPWNIENLTNGPEGEYLDDRITTEAINLIEKNDGTPFFLNLWYYLVHTPIMGKPELVEKYKRKAIDLGLDKLPTFADGGPHPTEHKKHINIKRRLLQSDPGYAAMVETMDTNIGRLLDTLERTKQLEKTVIVFTSDNGGLSTSESSPTCNAPLCEGKGWMYEGGTREPLLIHAPGIARAGSVCDVPVSSPDFYPTLLELAGLDPLPEQHVDGESLVSLLKGSGGLQREALYWHYPHYGNQGGRPGASIRAGDWKLIEFFEDDRVELYNLREDISESRDLAAAQPERAHALRRKLHAWQESVSALRPAQNKDWKG
ncbi:MAG: sulfatase [Planctomycetota bacterium]